MSKRRWQHSWSNSFQWAEYTIFEGVKIVRRRDRTKSRKYGKPIYFVGDKTCKTWAEVCTHLLFFMKPKNPAAVSLGKLARGVSKSFTRAELDRRRKRLADARVKRWPKKFTGQQDIVD